MIAALVTAVAAMTVMGGASIAGAADGVAVAGAPLNAREADVRPALDHAGCRPVLTRLSQHACGMHISGWGAPLIAMFVFHGEPERRLAIVTLSFEPDGAALVEQALLREYGAPDSIEDGDPHWRRGAAVIWIERERRRVVLATPPQVERVKAP